MSDVREALADHTRSVLLVLGAALVLLGGVGPGSVGTVSVLGLATLLAAFLLDEPIASLLRPADGAQADATPTDDPVSDLRERYVRGELDREEFERRVERLLDPDDAGGESPPGSGDDRRDTEVATESAPSAERSGTD